MKINAVILVSYLVSALTSSLYAHDSLSLQGSQSLSVRHYNDLETLLLNGHSLRSLMNYKFCDFYNASDSAEDDVKQQSDNTKKHESHKWYMSSVDWRTFYLIPPDHTDRSNLCFVTFKHNIFNTADLGFLFSRRSHQTNSVHPHSWLKLTVHYAVCSNSPEELRIHMSKRILTSQDIQEVGELYPEETYYSQYNVRCPLSAVRFYYD